MSNYQELMRDLHTANQEFKKEWKDWRNGKVKPTEKKKLKKLKGREPKAVTIARDKFYIALNRLYDTQLAPLAIAFCENPSSAADNVIEFLSVDITAHRSGYAKEWFLTKLKSVKLTFAQQLKLQQISLELCESHNFRRETNYWSRLMIKLADQDFVNKLNILSNSSNQYAQIKAKWLLNKILHHRKDLTVNSLEP